MINLSDYLISDGYCMLKFEELLLSLGLIILGIMLIVYILKYYDLKQKKHLGG